MKSTPSEYSYSMNLERKNAMKESTQSEVLYDEIQDIAGVTTISKTSDEQKTTLNLAYNAFTGKST